MKPKKNQIFCVACGRPKMLFETEAEAQAFIRFNSGDILKMSRKAPVRSYYCQLCGGYHVTSNNSKSHAEWLDIRDKVLAEEVDRRVKANLKPKSNQKQTNQEPKFKGAKENKFDILEQLEQSDILMTKGMLDEARELLEECRFRLQAVEQRMNEAKLEGFIRCKNQMEKLMRKLERLEKWVKSSFDDQEAFIAKEGKTEEEEEVCTALVSIKAVVRIKRALYDIDKVIEKREFSILKYYVAQCQKQIGSIRGPDRSEIAQYWNQELMNAQERASEARRNRANSKS
jgi:hypothetical protein